jgi:hypothetical protein
MRSVPSVAWVIIAVIVALILFFWFLPMVFGGDNVKNGAVLVLATLRR